MATLVRLPQGDIRTHLALPGQAAGRYKRVVQCVDHQGRQADVGQAWLGRRPLPVVLRISKTVQGRSERIVEVVQILRGVQSLRIKQTGELGQLLQRFGFHGVQEHAGVDLSAQAATQDPAAGGQVDRGRDTGQRLQHTGRRAARFLRPAQQGVAAQRHPHGVQRPAVAHAHTRQHPVYFFKITRVVGARCAVDFATAAAKMHDCQAPAPGLRPLAPSQRVMAV